MAYTQGGLTYHVTPEYVHHAGTSSHQTAAQVHDQLARLKTFVVSLEDSWKGVAANQFQQLMQEYDRNSAVLTHALNQIGTGLVGSGTNYSASEESNFGNLNRIQLSPAKLD